MFRIGEKNLNIVCVDKTHLKYNMSKIMLKDVGL